MTTVKHWCCRSGSCFEEKASTDLRVGEQVKMERNTFDSKFFIFFSFLPVFRIALLFPELLQLVALSAVTVKV